MHPERALRTVVMRVGLHGAVIAVFEIRRDIVIAHAHPTAPLSAPVMRTDGGAIGDRLNHAPPSWLMLVNRLARSGRRVVPHLLWVPPPRALRWPRVLRPIPASAQADSRS